VAASGAGVGERGMGVEDCCCGVDAPAGVGVGERGVGVEDSCCGVAAPVGVGACEGREQGGGKGAARGLQ